MNERIKQLAERAGFDLYEEDGSFRVEPGQWINAELEKFAELIVRDCAGYVHGHELFTALLNRYGVTE